MISHVILSALQQSLIFLPLTFGVFLSYEILAVTDLTVEGSFVFGAAVFAKLLTSGYSQTSSTILALVGGLMIGICVSLMQRIAKINSLIAGIIAVFMLYSINFSIMGRPNIGLLNSNTFVSKLQAFYPAGLWLFLISFMIILTAALILLLHSRLGLLLRAFGTNPPLLKKLGKSPGLYLAIGLAISNMLAALCGILTSQMNGYADIQMGVGMALTAIGAVVIGTKLFQSLFSKSKQFNAAVGLGCCFLGTALYFLILNLFLAIGINPIYLKLLLGLLLILFLSTAHYSGKRHIEYETFS